MSDERFVAIIIIIFNTTLALCSAFLTYYYDNFAFLLLMLFICRKIEIPVYRKR